MATPPSAAFSNSTSPSSSYCFKEMPFAGEHSKDIVITKAPSQATTESSAKSARSDHDRRWTTMIHHTTQSSMSTQFNALNFRKTLSYLATQLHFRTSLRCFISYFKAWCHVIGRQPRRPWFWSLGPEPPKMNSNHPQHQFIREPSLH